MDEQQSKELKEAGRAPLNAIDVLVFTALIFPLISLKTVFDSDFLGDIAAYTALFLGLSFFPYYIKVIRPKIMKVELLRMLVVQVPKGMGASPLGVMAALFAYLGALLVGLSLYYAAKGGPELKVTTDAEINARVEQRLKREVLYKQMEVLASAKPVSIEDFTGEEVETTTFEEMEVRQKAQAETRREEFATEIRDSLIAERQADYVESRAHHWESLGFGLFTGLALVFFSLMMTKLRVYLYYRASA